MNTTIRILSTIDKVEGEGEMGGRKGRGRKGIGLLIPLIT